MQEKAANATAAARSRTWRISLGAKAAKEAKSAKKEFKMEPRQRGNEPPMNANARGSRQFSSSSASIRVHLRF
jgi:hypothetical protein